MLPPEFPWDPEWVDWFEREVRAAARLDHPNIVTMYEFGQGEGQHFYTMALMPGGDLEGTDPSAPGGMAEAEARRVAAVVARGAGLRARGGVGAPFPEAGERLVWGRRDAAADGLLWDPVGTWWRDPGKERMASLHEPGGSARI